MKTKFEHEFHQFGILAVVVIVAIENLSYQAVMTQLISATVVVMLCVVYIITEN